MGADCATVAEKETYSRLQAEMDRSRDCGWEPVYRPWGMWLASDATGSSTLANRIWLLLALADPGCVGRVLPHAAGVGARRLRQVAEGQAGVRADLEVVPSDVRQHRHLDRQRTPFARQSQRAATGQTARQAVLGGADA